MRGHDGSFDSLRNPLDLRRVSDAPDHPGKLVPTHAGRHIHRAYTSAYAVRHRDEDPISDVVTEHVVQRLEAIEIEVEHREAVVGVARDSTDLVPQDIEEERAIRKTGECVVERG